MSDFTEYYASFDLKSLNVWSEVIDSTDMFIFYYIQRRFESHDEYFQKLKINNLFPVRVKHLREAFPFMGLSVETLRKRIKKMCDNGLLYKENHYTDRKKTLYAGLTQKYYQAIRLSQEGKNYQEIKEFIFPNGYLPTEVQEIEISRGKDGRFTTTVKNDRTKNWENFLQYGKYPPYQYGQIPPYINNLINYNLIKGVITINVITTSEPVENSKKSDSPLLSDLQNKGLISSVEEYAQKYKFNFKVPLGLKNKLRQLYDSGIAGQHLFKLCKEFIDIKKFKISIPEVQQMEFIIFIEEATEELLNPKPTYDSQTCPACGGTFDGRGVCYRCSYDLNQTEEWQREHIEGLSGACEIKEISYG